MTLDMWVNECLIPSLLNMFNLPDTEEGRRILDQLTEIALNAN